jgi:4-aminobutyrate aminotransferase-like enzyme
MSGVKKVRNINAFGAFDLVEMNRDEFLSVMQDNGILFGGCGTSSVRVRPSLVLDEDAVDCAINNISRILD